MVILFVFPVDPVDKTDYGSRFRGRTRPTTDITFVLVAHRLHGRYVDASRRCGDIGGRGRVDRRKDGTRLRVLWGAAVLSPAWVSCACAETAGRYVVGPQTCEKVVNMSPQGPPDVVRMRRIRVCSTRALYACRMRGSCGIEE